jgi:abhydrolase domain-containing protein 6
MFDEGTGSPIVVVQPLQGRWEWTVPLLRALARQRRVISYSLAGERGSGHRADLNLTFDAYVSQLRDVMDTAGLEQAAICGISFGGAIAARFAAAYPERVTRLVLVSAPGPGWRASDRQAAYVATPWRSLPAFTLGACRRAVPEIRSAIDTRVGRIRFALRHVFIALRHPSLPPVMAHRVRLLEALDLSLDCAKIQAPTLVVTGEPNLDRVVPVESTKRYAQLIPGARCVMMERTGHQGVLTQPERFAALVNEFVNGSHS